VGQFCGLARGGKTDKDGWFGWLFGVQCYETEKFLHMNRFRSMILLIGSRLFHGNGLNTVKKILFILYHHG